MNGQSELDVFFCQAPASLCSPKILLRLIQMIYAAATIILVNNEYTWLCLNSEENAQYYFETFMDRIFVFFSISQGFANKNKGEYQALESVVKQLKFCKSVWKQ